MESSSATSNFGQKLQLLLDEAGLKQSKLADALGVSRNTVSGWCKGTKTPTIERTYAIADFLDIPVYRLLEGAETLTVPPPELIEAARDGYLSDARWRMRPMPADGGRQGGNAAAFAFSPDADILLREVGQNSSDERRNEPYVELRISVFELSGEPLDRFLQACRFSYLRDHLEAAADENHKVGNIIREGLAELDSGKPLVLLRIDDYYATGLTGAERGKGSKFAAVMRNVLDSEKEETKGGSYGLGSNVMWACSRFGLVFCNSMLSDPQDGKKRNRVLGCVQLPSHTTPDRADWAGPGWFGKDTELSNEPVADSYWDNPALVRDLQLARDGDAFGTSFLIVQAYDPSGKAETLDKWHDQLVDAAAKHFWAAMTDRSEDEPAKLRITVQTERIGNGGGPSTKRTTYIDPAVLVPERVEMLRAYYDGRTVEELDQPRDVIFRPVRLEIPARRVPGDEHGPMSHDAVLLVTQAAEPTKDTNRLQAMRGSLMTIVDAKMRGLPLGARPFHAVLLAGEGTGSEDADARVAERMLRASEPPAHDAWESTSDLTDSYVKGAVQAIDNFLKAAKDEICKAVARPSSSDSDGPESLRSLLRMVLPKEPERRPSIRRIEPRLDSAGAWSVEVTVSLPPDGLWQLKPVVVFEAESGGGMTVRWSDLQPVDKCRVDEESNRVIPDEGARILKFRGVTDPASHPVSARYARAEVELRPLKGGSAK
jgi:transcriptional regulator with XRE-family HTH domain